MNGLGVALSPSAMTFCEHAKEKHSGEYYDPAGHSGLPPSPGQQNGYQCCRYDAEDAKRIFVSRYLPYRLPEDV